jgi:hypothetical protein
MPLSDEQIAALDKYRRDTTDRGVGPWAIDVRTLVEMVDQLLAERPPEGHVVDHTGKVWRVLHGFKTSQGKEAGLITEIEEDGS